MNDPAAASTDWGDKHDFEIIVNGRAKRVTSREVSFQEVLSLAFNPVPTGPGIIFTVTYRHAAGDRKEGTLLPGETVEVRDGTIFNASYTDKG